MTPAMVVLPPRRPCGSHLGDVRGVTMDSHSPSDPTGVGGRAPGTACWLSRAVPGRRPLCLCWLPVAGSSLAGGGGGASAWSKAFATGGRCARGLPLGLRLGWGACVFRSCSISRMRASRASSSVVCVVMICFLCVGERRCQPGKPPLGMGCRRLTACPPARRGRRRYSRCERCPRAPPRRSVQWSCSAKVPVSVCLAHVDCWSPASRAGDKDGMAKRVEPTIADGAHWASSRGRVPRLSCS
jgi:hypothetical protein